MWSFQILGQNGKDNFFFGKKNYFLKDNRRNSRTFSSNATDLNFYLYFGQCSQFNIPH